MRGREGFALLVETPEARVPNPRVFGGNGNGGSLARTEENNEQKAKEMFILTQ